MNLLDRHSLFATAFAPTAALLLGRSRPDLMRDDVLFELFSSTLERYPDRTVFITPERRWSYREADIASNAIAAGLQSAGIGVGDIVGLRFPRGVPLLLAQLAVTRCGAAWLPFDCETPAERIRVCLSDAGAKALLTTADMPALGEDVGAPVLMDKAISRKGAPRIDPRSLGQSPDQPAYMIYTSGSTGLPKGIVITHRNICHFLRAAQDVYELNDSDIVFQGASVAFDLSMEEIWMPYSVGAALFVADAATMADVERLPKTMRDYGITVIDTVPTLLSLFNEDIPALRVIILGGEACPPIIAERWCKPGRRVFNSYGPTEATVVATVAELVPGEEVTIGRPIPNYTCYVVNEKMELVAEGEEGELLIGGPGVARGYLKRPELTQEKFVPNPFPLSSMDPVLYRTGDAAIIGADGNIRFRGRIDDQVKIRGFRVELGEIEAKLAALPGILQASVVLRQINEMDQLVAFVLLSAGCQETTLTIREKLKQSLPSYMVPGRVVVLDELPTLVSGKVNRKALTTCSLPTPLPVAVVNERRTETEEFLHACAQQVFPESEIPLDADFFTELGGHSLLAARFVSLVRQRQEFAGLGLQDIYRERSLRLMAALLDRDRNANSTPADLSFTPPPFLRRFLCGAAQAVTLPFIIALMTTQWLGVFVTYMLLDADNAPLLTQVLVIATTYIGINIATTLFVLMAKWAILGRTKPGRYPLWGTYYYRWWLTQRLISLVHMKWIQGTPLLNALLRLFGARIADDVLLYEMEAGAIDLISIGNGSSIGGHCGLANAQVVGNELIIGRIDIGSDVYLGSSVVLSHDVVIGDGAELLDLTAIGAETIIGSGEKWDGSPARRIGMVDKTMLLPVATASRTRRNMNLAFFAVCALLIPPLGLLPVVPAFYILDVCGTYLVNLLNVDDHLVLPLIAFPTALGLTAATVALIVAIRWAVLPRLKEGVYSVHSGTYLRKWAVSFASEIALETLSSLYATVYMRAWYRMMGSKIGRGSEISTSLNGRYDLVEIGEKCFVADEVILGEEDIRRGWMTLKKTKVGNQVFLGNSSVIDAGKPMADRCLIGIKSKLPADTEIQAGDTWFGSPSIRLPVRQKFDGGLGATFEPSLAKKLGRATFEALFNLSVPMVAMLTCGTLAIDMLEGPILNHDYATAFPMFIAIGVAMSLSMTLVVVALKWIMMGRYSPIEKPMWSWWALRTEAIAVMYSGMAARMLLDFLRGTPFLPWALRLFGAKFGKGCYLDMTDLTEFDCVTVKDFVSINGFSALQTHLYEDRVMKVGRVSVGTGVSIEAGSTVLYSSHVGDYARLGPLTVVMKGESIPAHSEWHGAPASRKPLPVVEAEPVTFMNIAAE